MPAQAIENGSIDEESTDTETTDRAGKAVRRFILVGVDGSEQSSAALGWAATEARLRNTRLRVVHAWQVPTLMVEVPLPEDVYTPEAAQKEVEEQVRTVLGEEPGLPIDVVVREDWPARSIIDEASGAEMVVVGSRGRGGVSGLLLGSVSAQVAHHAPCPVVIVRPPAEPPAEG